MLLAGTLKAKAANVVKVTQETSVNFPFMPKSSKAPISAFSRAFGCYLLAEDSHKTLDHEVRRDADENDEEDGVLPLGVLSGLPIHPCDVHGREQGVPPVVQGPKLK